MSLLNTILTGALGIGQGAINAKQQRKNIRRQLAADKELAQFAYSQDLDMWERQNAYNAPTEQMARLRAAGLNPHLVYGSGSVAGNTAGQMPKYQNVRSDFSSQRPALNLELAGSMLGQFLDLEQQGIRNDTLRALRDQEMLKRDLLVGKIPETITGPTGKTKIEMSPYMSQLFQTQLDVQRATLSRIKADAFRTGVLGDISAIRRDYERFMQQLGLGGKGLKMTGDLWKLIRGK